MSTDVARPGARGHAAAARRSRSRSGSSRTTRTTCSRSRGALGRPFSRASSGRLQGGVGEGSPGAKARASSETRRDASRAGGFWTSTQRDSTQGLHSTQHLDNLGPAPLPPSSRLSQPLRFVLRAPALTCVSPATRRVIIPLYWKFETKNVTTVVRDGGGDRNFVERLGCACSCVASGPRLPSPAPVPVVCFEAINRSSANHCQAGKSLLAFYQSQFSGLYAGPAPPPAVSLSSSPSVW